MFAKFNSKTHLKNTVSVFLTVSSLFDYKVCKKWQMVFCKKCYIGIKKRRILCWFRIRKIPKNACEKSYQRKSYKKLSFLLLLLYAKVFGLQLLLEYLVFVFFNGFQLNIKISAKRGRWMGKKRKTYFINVS